MNLDCRFVVVWPQRQTFVRILLTFQNRPSASSRRPTIAQSHIAPQLDVARHSHTVTCDVRMVAACAYVWVS